MNLIETITDLIGFKSVTGNSSEIDNCLHYIYDKATKFGADVNIYRFEDASPVIMATNTYAQNFDVLILGHIDVVPADENMFKPIIKENKMFGRGTLDMKSFAAVALNSLEYVIKNKLDLKFGFVLSTDEETGSKSTKAFLEKFPNISAKIVLDNDVGGDITKIVARCKNPVFVKLISKGKAAHGSTPWNGIDANENLFQTWQNIRKFYPYYSIDTNEPTDKWIDTVHFATINGGGVSNIIADSACALLDFRLTENSSVDNLCITLDKCMENQVGYEIVSASTPVVMDENNKYIRAYKEYAQSILGKTIDFEYIGGATDSREFAQKGSIVIMHSGTGDGMHANNEYVDLTSVEQIAKIQIGFLEKLANQKI
ncbi:MAG: M20 family metallopeptidase [Alphaproteobacteria bacterium]|nr:M20 family metallopeptidase [Alphaproteobacteria bacterium]